MDLIKITIVKECYFIVKNTPHLLLFDSGVGGLSVFQEVHRMMPQLKYSYIFDNEAYPYGELDPDCLIERVGKIIISFVEAIPYRFSDYCLQYCQHDSVTYIKKDTDDSCCRCCSCH